MILDADTLDATACYKLLIGTVVPRAIGWVSTLSADGIANLTPFSFFTVVCRKPPMISLTMQPRSDRVTLKDTFVNIRDTGEFVVNLVSLPQADGMHASSAEHPPEADEFVLANVSRAPSEVVRPPRVAQAPVSLECRLERIIPLGEVGDHVVFGRVLRFHVRDDLYLEGGRVDTAALQPVGRLAAEYTLADNVFTCPLDAEVVAGRRGSRMTRLDARPPGWSPIDEAGWSAAGNAIVPGIKASP
ncbi:flavin reductase family protein [Methylobacterium sp. Gmos1]